uniref:Neural cell adhesion molecule L1-like protein n=1 Tax=Loxodonta africana TaxID=9785 RepID=G3U3P5_LOXAF
PKFPKEKINPLEVEEGDSIVLPCNPPKGLPPLHIYWMNIELEHIEQDERVYMSQKGDLYFANVEEKDSRNDYCCFAAFPRLRTIVQKMPMKLTVNSLKHANDSSSSTEIGSKGFIANLIKQRKPRLLLPPTERGSRSSEVILKGETLLLECFAEGLPTPQVEWDKLGGDLPKGRVTKENYNKTLKIENVSYHDKGIYRCTANNFLGTATHDFHVTIEEPPRWTKKPQSGVYNTESSDILICEAEGEPQPTIKWRMNGSPNINFFDSRGKKMSPKEISFTNLQPNNTAVLQCEASNIHGTILTNANVDVVDIHPLIQTEDEENYAAVVGYSAFLHCVFFASPKASVSWQKVDEAKPLEGIRYYIHENGTLQINKTTEEDAGPYSCWVENAKGKAAVTANLDIRNATKLRVSPKNPRVPRSHILELHCESKSDSHLKHSLKLSWSKDDGHITNMNRIIIDGANLTIANVTLEDQGVYSCLAQTALDSTADITQVTVLVSAGSPSAPVDLPDPPENLLLSERQNRSVRLSWEAGDDHNSNISEYIVEFEGNKEEPGRWEELTRVQGKETTVMLSLAPFVRYQFRVIAVNEVGRSQPSQPSDHHETPPAAPDKNPQNIRVQASQPKEMIIKWEPLKSMEQNGPGLEYRVTWKPQGAPVEWEEETVTNHTLRVMTPTVYAPYDVQVQAINQLGSGPEPHSVTLYSGEDYPDTAPVIHRVDVINSTVVKVTWSTIPKDRVHGRLKGYQISWWKTKSLLDGRTHPKEVNILRFLGPRNYGMVPSLDAFSEFHLTVLAYNSKGAGPESEPYIFQTPEGVPEQPTFLKVIKVDKDTATLSWGLPNKLNGNLTGYLLQYQIINDTYEIGELNDINITTPSKPIWHLSNLNATTKYKFYLRACTSKGCGKPVTEESSTLGEETYIHFPSHIISSVTDFSSILANLFMITIGSQRKTKKVEGESLGKEYVYFHVQDYVTCCKSIGKISEGVNHTQKIHPIEVSESGAEHIVRLSTKNWVDNNSIFEDVIETRGREYAGLYDDISTQGWFIGLMCAIALLTLILLTVCFVRRNKGGKYSVKEKEDLHPDSEVQSVKDETFGEYSDSDEKPLKGSLRSLNRDIQVTESADSLVEYGEGDHGLFNEDGSFIGAYTGSKEKGSVESNGSSTATFPLRA